MDLLFEVIQNLNEYQFKKGADEYVCTRCQKIVTLDGSCSKRGRNLICESCIDKIKEEEGIDFTSEVCEKYIWK